jgi:hypothetical protein
MLREYSRFREARREVEHGVVLGGMDSHGGGVGGWGRRGQGNGEGVETVLIGTWAHPLTVVVPWLHDVMSVETPCTSAGLEWKKKQARARVLD